MTSTTGQRKRGRPPKISIDAIVNTAVAIGLDTFSMDGVAESLGVTTPALYTHVASRAEVVRRGAALVLRHASSDDKVTDWQTWLRAWAERIRVELGGIGEDIFGAVRTGVDLAALDVAERGMTLMVDAGFSPADAGRALWLVTRIAFTSGAPRSEVASIARGVAGGAVPQTMQQAIDDLAVDSTTADFEYEMNTIIAGLEARLTAVA